jgi:mitogen-activated protein kinase 1/3
MEKNTEAPMRKVNLSVNTKKDDFAKWEVGNEYKLIMVVGKGSYGKVAEAIHIPTNKQVAIKMIEDVFDDEEDCKKIVREILLLKRMNGSKFTTNLLDIVSPPSNNYKNLFIVMEYVDADIKKVLRSSLELTQNHINVILYNLLTALKFVQTSNVLHRDIKPSNVLIDEDCQIKICDFGLARSMSGLDNKPE